MLRKRLMGIGRASWKSLTHLFCKEKTVGRKKRRKNADQLVAAIFSGEAHRAGSVSQVGERMRLMLCMHMSGRARPGWRGQRRKSSTTFPSGPPNEDGIPVANWRCCLSAVRWCRHSANEGEKRRQQILGVPQQQISQCNGFSVHNVRLRGGFGWI